MVEQQDGARARRIEVWVYVAAGVSLVLLGMVLTSKILNWIVGPAFIVAFVTMVTPLALRVAGVRDPDAGSYERWRDARAAEAATAGDDPGDGRAMSWAAHELESYFLQKHTKIKVSYLAILLGCLLPDLFTKLPVYGWKIGSFSLKASVPYKYHRGWPGAGFTHSLSFGLLVGLVVLAVWKNRAWFVGILIGQAAHVFTDICDSVGTMVLWPGTTQHYTIGMWAYASQAGRYGDAAAYYSSLGGIWDLFWLVLCIVGWRAFTREFFFSNVVPADPAWGWLRRKFALSDRATVALYRAFFMYGACRIFGWTLWARFVSPERGTQQVDYRWGGPDFVDKVVLDFPGWGTVLANTFRGAVVTVFLIVVMWNIIGRRLWDRAT